MVNVNTATLAQLELLPGVGASRAKAIIAYRATTPFAKVDELKKVKGVGKGVFTRIQPHVAVSGATTIAKVQGQGRAPAAKPPHPAAEKEASDEP
jgi:competence protein ComEA